MKTHHQFLILFAAVFFAARSSAAAPVSVSVSFFHEQLSPHGRWVAAASYGDVWIPSGVVAGWEPYVDGEWVYTDYGWTWIADDPWGDIPYHYGTWTWADPYGWCWVPGTIWAPAWVTWAYTDDYIGWAPVPPSFILTASGYVGAPIVVASTRYVFVPTTRFVGVRASTVRVAPAQNTTIFARATKTTRFQVSNGIVHTAGPPPARIEKATGRPVERASVERIKTQPTTLAAAGVSKSRSLHVVAPAKERAASATAQKSRETAATTKKTHENTAAAQKSHGNAEATKQTASAKPARPAPAAKPEAKPQSASSERPAHHPQPVAERPKAAAHKSKPQAKPQPENPPARPPAENMARHERAEPPSGSTSEQRPARAPVKKAPEHRETPPKEKQPPGHDSD
jgi:hypothetical protein